MTIPRKIKIILFIVGLVVGVALMLMGIFVADDIAQIRMEGSEL